MKKVQELLKQKLKNDIQIKKIWLQHVPKVEDEIKDLRYILSCWENNTITIDPKICETNEVCKNNGVESDSKNDTAKKRGRKPKASSVKTETQVSCEVSDMASLDDTDSSTSSSRSRRAAAQVAGHKMAQIQSQSQLKKLRRPTDFSEKQDKIKGSIALSPPSKCRRTRRNQSAGSSSSPTLDTVETEDAPDENLVTVDQCLKIDCAVKMERLTGSTIKKYTESKIRSSKSLDRLSPNDDLFMDSPTVSTINTKQGSNEAPNSDPSHKTNKKKSRSRKDLDSGISSTEEELHQLNLPVAQSSPRLSSVELFKGFDEEVDNNKRERQITPKGETTYVISENAKEKETNKDIGDGSPKLRSRTKTIRKETFDVKEKTNKETKSEDEASKNNSPETNIRSRTKTIRKHNEKLEDQGEIEDSERNVRSRTKTIRKHNDKVEQATSSEEDDSNLISRTKTIKKPIANEGVKPDIMQYVASEFKEDLKYNKKLIPSSPAQAKGELVKKRIEDFEKMQNGTNEIEEDKAVGRLTRKGAKNMAAASAVESQNSKQNRAMKIPASLQKTNRNSLDKEKKHYKKEDKENAPPPKVPLSVERGRMTPLGTNNRLTPKTDSNSGLQKLTSSTNRPPPAENNVISLVHKQSGDESEKRRKEEERLKRQLKEEEAKKKKEKTLKATAEEARRKREEKLQKVAAAREAAEKEKERLAAKAEKEKEEKLRQIAAEKEKQKEEQLKKKQLMQQKLLEHEERRKQEEAARLAKLREQEEEHKRLAAIKERELEMQKHHKAELRLAEAEKSKHQGTTKLGKLAAVNNAKMKLQQGMTPTEKKNAAQAVKSYEITPAREDRPLLPPKTENDYGIDDANSGDSSDEENHPKKIIPSWAQPKNREKLLCVNYYIPKKLWDLFMECDPNPDITQMFAGNPIKKRIRTSSAVWRTPPKYSQYHS